MHFRTGDACAQCAESSEDPAVTAGIAPRRRSQMGLLDTILCRENYLGNYRQGPILNTIISTVTYASHRSCGGQGDGMTAGIEEKKRPWEHQTPVGVAIDRRY